MIDGRYSMLMSSPLLFRAANAGPLTGSGNNTWLIDGAEPALIDAGIGQLEHVDAIARALGGRPLASVLVTHGHADHASGVPALRARWPAIEATKFVLPGEEGWRALAPGERVRAGDTDLEVIHTPGHAPDHVCFWNAATGDLFAGDMIVKGTTIMIPAGRGGSMRDYMRSLARIQALNPTRIFPGHGPVIDQPLELLAQYIEHRQMREAQVLACLADGITAAGDMLARIYPDLPDALRPAALATIEAHLEKLRDERQL